MNNVVEDLKLDNETILTLEALCEETHQTPSQIIQAAITAYKRMRANEKYLGQGELDLSNDHPDDTKRLLKQSIQEKYGYSA